MVFSTLKRAEGQVFRYVDSQGVIHYSDVRRDERFERAKEYEGDPLLPPVAEASHPTTLSEYIEGVSSQYDLDPRLVRAVIQAESNFDRWAVSPKGAMGLMQLMPETARSYRISNPLDPHENIEGGARHLRYLLNRYHGDLELVLAAYNAGQERVQRYKGIPPYRETQDYIQRVLGYLRSPSANRNTKKKNGTSEKGGRIYRYVSPDGVTLFTDTSR